MKINYVVKKFECIEIYKNNDLCKNALYEIFQYMFTNDYYD